MDTYLTDTLKVLSTDCLYQLYTKGTESTKRVLGNKQSLTILNKRFQVDATNFNEFLQLAQETPVDADCPNSMSGDACLRKAAKQGREDLVQNFSEDATDISGAVAEAAKHKNLEILTNLESSGKMTEEYYGLAAAHAALGGHHSLVLSMYKKDNKMNLETVLEMAVLGGNIRTVTWCHNKGVTSTRIRHLIGRNWVAVSKILGTELTSKALFRGVANFGSGQDLGDYIIHYNLPKDMREEYLGCLENNNTDLVSFFDQSVDKSTFDRRFYSNLCKSAAIGKVYPIVRNNINKAHQKAPAVSVVISQGNEELVAYLEMFIKDKLNPKFIPYAAYSGVYSLILKYFPKEATLEDTEAACLGAAAGGNWNIFESMFSSYTNLLNESIAKKMSKGKSGSKIYDDEVDDLLSSAANEAYVHLRLSFSKALDTFVENILFRRDKKNVEARKAEIMNEKLGLPSILTHL